MHPLSAFLRCVPRWPCCTPCPQYLICPLYHMKTAANVSCGGFCLYYVLLFFIVRLFFTLHFSYTAFFSCAKLHTKFESDRRSSSVVHASLTSCGELYGLRRRIQASILRLFCRIKMDLCAIRAAINHILIFLIICFPTFNIFVFAYVYKL